MFNNFFKWFTFTLKKGTIQRLCSFENFLKSLIMSFYNKAKMFFAQEGLQSAI